MWDIQDIFWHQVSLMSIGKPYIFRAPWYSWDHRVVADKNIQLLSDKINKQIIIADQYHSCDIVIIDKDNKNRIPKADAIITQLHDVALFVIASDCVPILIFDTHRRTIGAIHAGRKWLEWGIIWNTIKNLDWDIAKIQAFIWPCISQDKYELWYAEIKGFKSKYTDCISDIEDGKYLLNIEKIACKQLQASGIPNSNIHISWECTYENEIKYHSYRRNTHKIDPLYWNNAFWIWLK